MIRNKIICEECGLEISKSNYTKHLRRHKLHPETFKKETLDNFVCDYCGKVWKNKNSLVVHRRACKLNPERINYGGKANHARKLKRPVRLLISFKPSVYIDLDISYSYLENYKKHQQVCEICGKHRDNLSKYNSKIKIKNLCIDHDHTSNTFRGLLCSTCNRNLGWYENNKQKVEKYLNKNAGQ